MSRGGKDHPYRDVRAEYRRVWKNPEGIIHREGGPDLIDAEKSLVWYKDKEVGNSAEPAVIHPGGRVEFIGRTPPRELLEKKRKGSQSFATFSL